MHYYKRNLGDYAKKAGRLSMLQHGSYTLLIDACYDREQFPTMEEAIEWTWASTTEEIEAVQFVLRKFFTLEDGVYVQTRIQEELAEYRLKAEKNKRIATERETNRREKNTNRAPVVNEPPPNHKPLTINQEPLTNIKTTAPEKPARFDPLKLELPLGLKTESWSEWVSYRKKTGKALKPDSWVKQVEFLESCIAKGFDPGEMIKTSIRNGYAGLFEPKRKTDGNVRFLTPQQQRDENNRRSTEEFLADDGPIFKQPIEGEYSSA